MHWNCARFHTLTILLILFLVIALHPASADAEEYWVDATAGDDNDPGTELLPFATITYAIANATGDEITIHVLPGLYDAAHGESFPITLQSKQSLVGDPVTKGEGPDPTRIVGKGSYAGLSGIGSLATVVCGEGSSISGFEIDADVYEVRHAAVVAHETSAAVSDNRLLGACYAGIYLSNAGSSEVSGNVMESSSYGVYMSACPDAPIIVNNLFVSPALAIDIGGHDTNPWVHDNVFQTGSRVAVHVQHGRPRIESNTFEAGSGAVYGGIYASSETAFPVVRSNTFLNALGVGIREGNPDLGTDVDHGLNDFTGVQGVCIKHDGDATVYAIGNTWPNEPPIIGEDIILNGDGQVNVIAVGLDAMSIGRLKAGY